MTEKFFVKVKGWEKKYYFKGSSHFRWVVNGKGVGHKKFPKLHESLDLQEKWVWPELRKKKYANSEFIDWDGRYECFLRNGETINACAGTKPIAQLKAALNALGEV